MNRAEIRKPTSDDNLIWRRRRTCIPQTDQSKKAKGRKRNELRSLQAPIMLISYYLNSSVNRTIPASFIVFDMLLSQSHGKISGYYVIEQKGQFGLPDLCILPAYQKQLRRTHKEVVICRANSLKMNELQSHHGHHRSLIDCRTKTGCAVPRQQYR